MSDLVRFYPEGDCSVIAMDDGRLNLMSPAMLRALHQAFDRAEREKRVVVLKGRENIFSAGFDLKVIRAGDPYAVYDMMRLGAELALRVLEFPLPVIGVASGHAYPMGAFLLLASDIRIGATGPYRFGLNEVAIGLAVPSLARRQPATRTGPSPTADRRLSGWITGGLPSSSDSAIVGVCDRTCL